MLSSQAQRGKDQLDCHFSYIKRAFEKYIDHGGDITSQQEMFQALAESKLRNTSVLYADTTHSKIEKFPLPKNLGVQRVHQYKYQLRREQTEGDTAAAHIEHIEIRHHNNVDAHMWQCDWNDPRVLAWLSKAKFKREVAKLMGVHTAVPDLLQRTPPKTKSHQNHAQYDEVSPWERQIVDLACSWAQEGLIKDVAVAGMRVGTAEAKDVVTVPVGGFNWAVKKNLPPVRMPVQLKRLLIRLFNRVPHVSPESAVTEIQMDPEYVDDIFVRYMITPARVKQYFGSLKSKKKGDAQKVDEGEAESAKATSLFGTVRQMKAIIKKRGIFVMGGVSRMKRVDLQTVLQDARNGLDDGGEWDVDDIEIELGEEATQTDISGSVDAEELQNENLEGFTLEELLQGVAEEGGIERAMDMISSK